MKIPKRLLEHRIKIRPVKAQGGSTGKRFEEWISDVPCLIEDKAKLVIDMRPDSETRGQEIVSSSHIVAWKENYVAPGSEILLWAGKPNERTVTVVAAGYNEHSIAPNSAQFWTV